MKSRIIWKFWGAYVLLTFCAILVLNFFVKLRFQDFYERKISANLTQNAFLASDILRDDLSLQKFDSIQKKTNDIAQKLGLRVTVIDGAGRVLGDSDQEPTLMENHIDRQETVNALSAGVGESSRVSTTLGFDTRYLAVAVKDGDKTVGVVRLAMPLVDIEEERYALNMIFVLGGILAIGITLIIGYFVSRNITSPIHKMSEAARSIEKGDFSKRVRVNTTDEFGDLAGAINKMADELQVKIDNLQKLDKIRTDFVANVSHELKTPLTSIKGFVETLEDGAIDDKENARKFVTIIRKHVEKLDNIINDLLDLAAIEGGGEKIDIDKVSMNILLDEVVWGFGQMLSVKEQQMNVDYKGNDFEIRGDKDKIEQVLVNLVDNAIKYTGKNGKITASLFEKKDAVMLVIEDNGIGISKEHLDRIFERFYRVDKARSRELGGTGLGLSIVKHSVMLHKGHIDIDSELTKGTKITIVLPK